jgi:hypothetical protein
MAAIPFLNFQPINFAVRVAIMCFYETEYFNNWPVIGKMKKPTEKRISYFNVAKFITAVNNRY